MSNEDENPLDTLEKDLRERNPDRKLEFEDSRWIMDEDTDDGSGGALEDVEDDGDSMIVSEGGRPLARIDYKPQSGGTFGVARPKPDGTFPENPPFIREGKKAYGETLDEADKVIKGS